ncbi:hypothetical protein Fmac_023572 [Flemingia macrophylla]|uniref:Uncharacterized protein n=1 Tax=Flemingia macrophylla TaxID=520843 RepID=A0ABD1LLX0_9FABA
MGPAPKTPVGGRRRTTKSSELHKPQAVAELENGACDVGVEVGVGEDHTQPTTNISSLESATK